MLNIINVLKNIKMLLGNNILIYYYYYFCYYYYYYPSFGGHRQGHYRPHKHKYHMDTPKYFIKKSK